MTTPVTRVQRTSSGLRLIGGRAVSRDNASPPSADARWEGSEGERLPSLSAVMQDLRIAARSSGRKVVFLPSTSVWAFEARERLVFVHAPQGTFDIDVTLGELQSSLGAQFLRVHRNWLVSLTKVRELESVNGVMQLFAGGGLAGEAAERQGIDIPVARDRMKHVRQLLLADTFGVRPAMRNRRGRTRALTT